MAADRITYASKDASLGSTDPRKLFRDIDANEIKNVVNSHADLLDNMGEGIYSATITNTSFTANRKLTVEFPEDSNPDLTLDCEGVKNRTWYLLFTSSLVPLIDFLGFTDWVEGGKYTIYIVKGYSDDMELRLDDSLEGDVAFRDSNDSGATAGAFVFSGTTGSRFALEITVRQGTGIVEYMTDQIGWFTRTDRESIDTAISDARAYAESLVTGLWDDRGNFDASVNAYPSTGGSGASGAIRKGDIWTVSVAGTLPTAQVVEIGDTVRAKQDNPGNTQSNWAIQQNNIGYVAENSTNKTSTVTGNETSTTLYLTVKGYYDYLIGFTWLSDTIFGTWINARTAKTTPVDGDTFLQSDSQDTNKAKKVSWANIKATLLAYFNTQYVKLQIWSTITFGSTLNWDCENAQFPLSKTTATGDFTLNMSNVKNGSSGILQVLTNTASGITITFDTDYTNIAIGVNTSLTDYPLPVGTGKTYYLQYLCDGTNLYWSILDGSFLLLTGDVTTNPLGVATISANAVTISKINNADKRELVVTSSTVQAALNAASGYVLGVKTGISNLLAGQIFSGLSDDGYYYNYTCVADGVAYRTLAAQPQAINTVNEISQELTSFFANAGNTSTTETDLYSYTIPAAGTIGNLSLNGQSIYAEYAGTTVGHATATRRLRLVFAGSTVFDSGALVTASGITWFLRITIIRVSATVIRVYGSLLWGSTPTPIYFELTGLTLSATNVLKITGQAGDTGAATNDIVATGGGITFKATRS